ncbi:hypothetical protein [Terrisporobacter mayombei]|uniref:Uncharacterized protein n=1 Tax=Terrisporobacter mayombei TaxID=1541 RepID=A0ABY9PWZ7_9FIRM|nr:hypothetical protein [Terrisporobacter mayombei]MCC3870278.1 hypothetical protein [Terrisporobacter mayombei]WMT79904.1 hypothetical protein TEMA_01750 [Terrisporobacter mayombei]
MLHDKRNIRCNELADIFEAYLVMEGARDYCEASIREDAPKNVKDAHKEYIKIKNEILKDKAKSPFV